MPVDVVFLVRILGNTDDDDVRRAGDFATLIEPGGRLVIHHIGVTSAVIGPRTAELLGSGLTVTPDATCASMRPRVPAGQRHVGLPGRLTLRTP